MDVFARAPHYALQDWASNATHLGAVYIERGTYYRAALCFLAAQKMIDRFWGWIIHMFSRDPVPVVYVAIELPGRTHSCASSHLLCLEFLGAGNTPERFLNPPAAKTPESNVDGLYFPL